MAYIVPSLKESFKKLLRHKSAFLFLIMLQSVFFSLILAINNHFLSASYASYQSVLGLAGDSFSQGGLADIDPTSLLISTDVIKSNLNSIILWSFIVFLALNSVIWLVSSAIVYEKSLWPYFKRIKNPFLYLLKFWLVSALSLPLAYLLLSSAFSSVFLAQGAGFDIVHFFLSIILLFFACLWLALSYRVKLEDLLKASFLIAGKHLAAILLAFIAIFIFLLLLVAVFLCLVLFEAQMALLMVSALVAVAGFVYSRLFFLEVIKRIS